MNVNVKITNPKGQKTACLQFDTRIGKSKPPSRKSNRPPKYAKKPKHAHTKVKKKTKRIRETFPNSLFLSHPLEAEPPKTKPCRCQDTS